MKNYVEILKINAELIKSLSGRDFKIVVLSNIIVNQLKEILEYSLRVEGIKAIVTFGTYNNILQDTLKYEDADAVILFWEAFNFEDGFFYKAETIDNKGIEGVINQIKSEIDFVFVNLKSIPIVLFNTFSSTLFGTSAIQKSTLESCCLELNKYLETTRPSNNYLVNLETILSTVSREKAFNKKFFFSSKMLYTVEFFFEYAYSVLPIFRAITGKSKKILVFDCDNTLWKGIVGEDGINGIDMTSKTTDGIVFQEIQYLALALKNKGVLLGICSKNNQEDVFEVFEKRQEMILTLEDFAICKINWSDKVSNLSSIAKELNIGLDSLIYIDDSEFEINFIKENLSEVKTFLVPQMLADYPMLFRKISSEFFTLKITEEDLKRSQMYHEQGIRENIRSKYVAINDYLKSLHIKVLIEKEMGNNIDRISQLTYKTNQFNFTTYRYSENQIFKFVNDKQSLIYSFSVSDKYGEYGRTGVMIIKLFGNNAHIDTFLMSCRILGRKIEFVFFDFIMSELKKLGIYNINANYIRTLKNNQIEFFYEELGFTLLDSNEIKKTYKLELKNYKYSGISYLEVIDGR